MTRHVSDILSIEKPTEVLAKVIVDMEEEATSNWYANHGSDSDVSMHEVNIHCGSAREIVERLMAAGYAITPITMPVPVEETRGWKP
jgi:hypothetical protein